MQYYASLGFERLPAGIIDALLKASGQGGKREAACTPVKEDDASNAGSLEELRLLIGDCRRCRLSEKRTNLVFGEGDPNASLMFVGEAPGRDEDIQGRPFVGKAGQLLTNLIIKMGLSREEVYIANTVKCRPPENRKPFEDEIGTCRPFLKRQIELINPVVIMTLGDVATKALIGDAGNISKVRGRVFKYGDIPVVPTFHPSYLLRNAQMKWLTWDDAQLILNMLGRKAPD